MSAAVGMLMRIMPPSKRRLPYGKRAPVDWSRFNELSNYCKGQYQEILSLKEENQKLKRQIQRLVHPKYHLTDEGWSKLQTERDIAAGYMPPPEFTEHQI